MKSLKEYVYGLMDNNKPWYLVYHDKEHTQEVLSSAMRIAKQERVSEEEIYLLETAALLHDIGYLYTAIAHEEKSCEIAREILPRYNFTSARIDEVCKMIMATKIPQQPTDHLSQILCDADLSYLGTNDYAEDAEKLFHELRNFNQEKTREEWLQQQINFLKAHHYFTATANKEFKRKKNQHLSFLKSQLSVKSKHVKYKMFGATTDIILVMLGILLSGFALKYFIVPNDFFDGGISGVSLLIHKIFGVNLGAVIALANLPFIILARRLVDFKFALATAICIFLLSTFLFLVPDHRLVDDRLLASVFGGFFLGIGNGLVIRAGSSLDGIEILALYTRRKTSFTTTEIIFVINFIIFLIAALRFDLNTSMYSMITYFTASKTVDYVVEGIEAYTGVTIISGKSELLKNKLVNELGRGITIYKGERGYLPGNFEVHSDTDIIFTVITRLELRRLKEVVYDTDPMAFVFASVIKEASGGVLKKRKVHEDAHKPVHKK